MTVIDRAIVVHHHSVVISIKDSDNISRVTNTFRKTDIAIKYWDDLRIDVFLSAYMFSRTTQKPMHTIFCMMNNIVASSLSPKSNEDMYIEAIAIIQSSIFSIDNITFLNRKINKCVLL